MCKENNYREIENSQFMKKKKNIEVLVLII